jgi:hypothetical protein
MQMLLPFNSVCRSCVFLRPVGVISLANQTLGLPPWQCTRFYALLGHVFQHHVYASRRFRDMVAETGTWHSLTKSSKPRRVPVNSRSFFITTHIREPMQRSISSVVLPSVGAGNQLLSADRDGPSGRICDAMNDGGGSMYQDACGNASDSGRSRFETEHAAEEPTHGISRTLLLACAQL